ncbi:unnamed protein product [Clonostachys rosea]|uniref:Zn(2)-C6 fungal-type domain-containing protein n=1 Tax=Bionectria ochroleuca TaxID=29856 RepID=A0ABY6ULX4_BIOOC|nr:unnamed protein product [Clonostachys rosea]
MSSFHVFDANAERQSPTFMDFTHTFVLCRATDTDQTLSEIPKALALNVSRKRRVHNKSRRGCENCRRRRVKCNEGNPCENCTRRGDTCMASANISVNERSHSALSALPNSISSSTMVNLHHMKLFHHFESFTHKTLLIDPSVWKTVMQLSFHFEYLMNTILCVAARHLSLLQPCNIEHSATAAQHLCRALSLFQYQLSTSFTSTHIDAFIATTLLLLYEVWSQPGPLLSDDTPISTHDASKDGVFSISSSLKKTFLNSVPLISQPSPSIFLPYLQNPPMRKLAAAAQISRHSLAKFQEFFSHSRPLNINMLTSLPSFERSTSDVALDLWQHHVHDSSCPIEGGYVPAIGRLCLILAFLPRPRQPELHHEGESLLPDLARCIFMFPVSCHGAFASMVQQSDPHALLVLYHFYRATRILLCSSEYWWAHEHASRSEKWLKNYLTQLITDLNSF